jgi:hypothetical protein
MTSRDANIDDEDLTVHACCAPIQNLARPIDFSELDEDERPFFHWPIFGPLLVENESSDARDHCANERSTNTHSHFITGNDCLTYTCCSISIISSSVGLYGHCLGSHHAVFPSKE